MKKNFEFRPVPGRKWMLEVRSGSFVRQIRISPPRPVSVTRERYDKMQVYDMNTAPWGRTQLKHLIASGCTACFALVPESFVLTDEKGHAYKNGPDYYLDDGFGTFMRMPDGAISDHQPVFASYLFFNSRLDSVILQPDGEIICRTGVPHIAAPHEPELKKGEKRLANIYFTGHTNVRLTDEMIYPIVEHGLPTVPSQIQFLPKTMKKLTTPGETLRILVWGDSVTECTYLPEKEKYQMLFLRRLKTLYPDCRIEMRTLGWGGRCTKTFMDEPSGSPYNYAEQVLAGKPDLVISEFVNDCGMAPETYEPIYRKILKDFRKIGTEWLILTPHYIKINWMSPEMSS